MRYNIETLSYCFNRSCRNSIIYPNHPGPIGIEIEVALANNFNCPACGEELVSPFFNMMRESLEELIKGEQANVMLLDDDLIFHCFVKQTLNQDLINAEYATNGYAVLNQLRRNIDNEELLPDIIFLDLEMPILNGWLFLDMFKDITENLNKKIEIYIISSCDPTVVDLSKYPFVNCFISKKSILQFLEKLSRKLSKIKISQPRITLSQV